MGWEIYVTDQVKHWLTDLDKKDEASHRQVVKAIDTLADTGPSLGRPLVDRVKGSRIHNLKELRPGSSNTSEMRVLFAFDPWRCAILLIAGDKAGNWSGWYRQAIPQAERLYATYLQERAVEETQEGSP